MTSHDIRQWRSRDPRLAWGRIKCCLHIAVAAVFVAPVPQLAAQVLTPERQQITSETAQPQPELDSLSGWLAIEVAVLTDTSAGTLNAEQWPLFPQPRYPSVARWLKNPDLIDELTARYPEAAIAVDDNGAITVLLPVPVIAAAVPAVDFGDRSTPTTTLNSAAASARAAVADTGIPAANADTDTPQTFAIPLEQVDAPEVKTRAGANWLDDFESLSTPPPSDGESEYSAENAESQADDLAAAAEPPPLPEAFKRHDPSMLAAGLAALTKNTGDQLQTVQAWLQPPGASNLPIVFDRSGDVDTWPALQGFIELRRGSDLRMGINFWLNTDGSYLPEGFVVEPPPRGPQQITLFKPIDDANFAPTESLYTDTDAYSGPGEQTTPVSSKPVQFIDPLTGLRTEDTLSLDRATALEKIDTRAWQWRHVIQVADTRPVEENTVRYFDHPVIKVVATYRELTWGEVYELGAIEAEAAATEAALHAAEAAAQAGDQQPANMPAGQVPPGNAPIR